MAEHDSSLSSSSRVTASSDAEASGNTPALGRILAWAGATLFLLGVLRFGWVSDDAFITARAVDNLLSGGALGPHPEQRVQTFTSPLGMLLVLGWHALLDAPYPSLILPNLFASGGLVALLLWWDRGSSLRAGLVLLALATSSAILTFSTSGLENSLAHLLLVAFVLTWFRANGSFRRLVWVFSIAGLIFLTRFDLALLLLPPVVLQVVREPKNTVKCAWPGALLVAAWLLFALVYYGFFFPNTAYAKLNTDIESAEKLTQGLAYVVDAAHRDPLLLLLLVGGVAASFSGTRKSQAVAAGALLYLLYVIVIGGDFMSGRFLTAPTVTVVVAGAFAHPAPVPRFAAAFAAVTLFLAVPLLEDRRADSRGTSCRVPPSGVVDERSCYIDYMRSSQNLRTAKWREHPYLETLEKRVRKRIKRDEKKNRKKKIVRTVIKHDLVGMATFVKGLPPVRIVERYALTDPLLARISFSPDGDWRPGHLKRKLPKGYIKTLRRGKMAISDPCVRQLHRNLQNVTTGPLFSKARWKAIAALWFGSGTCSSPK